MKKIILILCLLTSPLFATEDEHPDILNSDTLDVKIETIKENNEKSKLAALQFLEAKRVDSTQYYDQAFQNTKYLLCTGIVFAAALITSVLTGQSETLSNTLGSITLGIAGLTGAKWLFQSADRFNEEFMQRFACMAIASDRTKTAITLTSK